MGSEDIGDELRVRRHQRHVGRPRPPLLLTYTVPAPFTVAECRRELAGPHGRSRTIAVIGRRWAFVDAAHFSRVFKRAYGMTPREWRDLHRPR
ncbi:hypothetical protein GCM10010250_31380 [Streptomyces althioticus]|jgi:AraC-like DNA-binding protein|uniref:HTH araC/xylS-type domain-containing protein n=1 Tax=Streptomyces griseorubens TaxID=66897 RepID=A0ABR4SS69_9ACTN|nr:AraC family transcriptional regulator [Actinospica acidiphila]ALV53938.1 hypothetical protein ASR50_34025 [Streptomyces sp. 4F]KEG38045.1 hypothetical protein DJ64_23940 [Streptomyces griseorubens]GGQ56712.1 hypothetical protein GCM10010250_31380 [Streptomyces althioticus]GGT41545.1 hypothetical protein GCM10010243_18450 [Streptomyces matensis]